MRLGLQVIQDDYKQINSASFIPWEELRDRTILITGATGLIGSSIVNGLCYVNDHNQLNITIVALIRDLHKAKEVFHDNYDSIRWIVGDVVGLPEIEESIDYIIHGAGPTSSSFFAQHPVETVEIIYSGTKNMLEIARRKRVKSFVFLSSMEVYGSNNTDKQLYESTPAFLDQMNQRSCYPEAKRLAENLCVCYHSEYSVPAKVVRLSQTFGPGIPADDNRVFVQFANAAINRNDIILHTKGDSKRVYLYTADAVTAVLVVLLRGTNAQAYNAGNPDTYCSIYDMAKLVAKEIANGEINVRVPGETSGLTMYPPPHAYNLNVDKLKDLGWVPSIDLIEMYRRMIISQTTRALD